MNRSSKNRRHMNTNYVFKHNFVYCSVTQTFYFFHYLNTIAEYKIHRLLNLQVVCNDLLTTRQTLYIHHQVMRIHFHKLILHYVLLIMTFLDKMLLPNQEIQWLLILKLTAILASWGKSCVDLILYVYC